MIIKLDDKFYKEITLEEVLVEKERVRSDLEALNLEMLKVQLSEYMESEVRRLEDLKVYWEELNSLGV